MAKCDYFSLVFKKSDNDKSKYVFQEIYSAVSEYITDRKNIGYHPDSGTSFQNADIIYCECNRQTNAILQTANSIFDWNGETLPEELCFYLNGNKWFVCICHEKYLFVYNETKEDITFMKNHKIVYVHGA